MSSWQLFTLWWNLSGNGAYLQWFCVLKRSFPRCRHSHIPLVSSPLSGSCWLDKHCQTEFQGVKLAHRLLFNLSLFIYVFIKFVLKWEEGRPLFFSLLNKVCFAKTDFTASLLALCELPASIWSGDRCLAAKCIRPQLFFSDINTHACTHTPCLPFAASLLFVSTLCHTHIRGTNSCYAIWPFLLSAVDIEHNLRLWAGTGAQTHTHKEPKVL